MRVGIVVPAYDVAPWIGACVASVIAQSHTDWAMVVVDDGSTDGTVACIPADPRVRVIAQANAGVSAARNAGMAALGRTCDALLFLDADDWLAPDALARMVTALARAPEAAAAYGAYCFVPEDGGAPVASRAGPFPSGDILDRLVVRNLFANGGHLLIRREAAERVGWFTPGIAFGEDWHYWIRLAAMARFAVVPGAAPLLFVRQRNSGAYLRMASRSASFRPVLDAVFSTPSVRARLGARLPKLRRAAEAEAEWIVGRELIRHGRVAEGRARLRRAVAARPSLRRAALLTAAHAPAIAPARLRAPFRRYAPSP
jgi:CTP:molybdopterin cytidylyltransferase MocA